LAGTQVTDVGIRFVSKMKSLTELDLSNTDVGDGAAELLSENKKLCSLELNGTQLTDEGMKHLVKLPQLQSLSVKNTHVTAEGISLFDNHKKMWSLEAD
jgi:hypothetical protein